MRKLTLILALLLSGCTTVDAGQVGVQVWFGDVQDGILPEGFHWVNPCMDIIQMNTQTKTVTMEGPTSLHVMASDQVSLTVDVSVIYHLEAKSAPGIYRFMPDYEDSVLIPTTRVAVRDAVREFDAVSAVSTKRREVGEEMLKLLLTRLSHTLHQRGLSKSAVSVDDFQLRNVTLPDALQDSIAKVQQERQAANQRQQAIKTAGQEAERSKIEAEGRARVAIIKAKNAAEVRLIEAQAEAEANRTIAASLTPPLLEARRIEARRAVLESDGTRTIFLGNENPPAILLQQGP